MQRGLSCVKLPHMYENLRKQRDVVPTPKLTHSNGVACVVTGERVTQFASEEAARFFVGAHMMVPVMLDQIAELEKQMAPGLVERMVQDIALRTLERDLAHTRITELERQLEVQSTARARAELQAKASSMVARRTLEMAKLISSLQNQLAEARRK